MGVPVASRLMRGITWNPGWPPSVQSANASAGSAPGGSLRSAPLLPQEYIYSLNIGEIKKKIPQRKIII